jgi:hypothetical protein
MKSRVLFPPTSAGNSNDFRYSARGIGYVSSRPSNPMNNLRVSRALSPGIFVASESLVMITDRFSPSMNTFLPSVASFASNVMFEIVKFSAVSSTYKNSPPPYPLASPDAVATHIVMLVSFSASPNPNVPPAFRRR